MTFGADLFLFNKARLLVGFFCASWLAACGQAGTSTESPTIAAPQFELIADGDDFPIAGGRAERGYLTVPADRETPGSGTYKLPVAIIRADEGVPKRPPVIMMSGGPGVGSLNAAAYPGAYPWVGERDFIVFGQRGTEHAQPALLCPDYNALHFSPDEAARAAAAQDCRDGFEAEDIDLSTFHTKAIAADVNDLREALGYDQVALYGLSYGTRVALTVARDFPDTVERMVLDSVMPHTVRYDRDAPESFRRVLLRIMEYCSNDTDCQAAYGNDLNAGLARIEAADETPLTIETEEGERVDLSSEDLIGLVPFGSASGTSQIPAILSRIAQEDASTLAPLFSSDVPTSNFDWGMRLSVWCSEAWPHSQPMDAPFAGLDLAVVSDEICEVWDVEARPLSDRHATVSGVPILILSGELDPLTPVEWAYEASETLSNAQVVSLRNGYHTESTNWGGDGCAMSLAGRFMSQEVADLGALDLGCANDRSAPDFQLPDTVLPE